MNNALTKTLTAGLMHGIISMYNENQKAIGRVISVDVLYNNCTIEFSHGQQRCEYQDVKPYIFPMSALTEQELREQGFNVYLADHLKMAKSLKNWDRLIQRLSFEVVEYLISKHYNVFNLSPEEFIEVNEDNNPYR